MHVATTTLIAAFAPLPLQQNAASSADSHPSALFRSLNYGEARAAANAEGKLLLLDAMTSWCGPCKVIDRTTWVNPRVKHWVETYAVGVTAFPTIIMFRPDGSEFDRVVV